MILVFASMILVFANTKIMEVISLYQIAGKTCAKTKIIEI